MRNTARFAISAISILIALAIGSSAQPSPNDESTFAPFQRWMAAVLTGDTGALKSLYSTNPPAQIRIKTVMHDADADTGFWLDLKSPTMKVEIVRLIVRPTRANVIFRADVESGGQTITVTDDQGWQKQGDQWRLLYAERTDDPKLQQPADMKKDLYPADADAHAEIREAEERAAKQHKRLLLVVGANWCFDCHVLDLAFHSPQLQPILAANYEVVHIDIGPDGKKNTDVLQQFNASTDKGVPALVVAESDGKVVFSQRNGEFEDARGLTPDALAEFLNKWKPQAR
ncbi:MAG TPA: thioredoxin family protein [Verrucomicrobiae bacterium]|nr:thioredoxin family protein [Verrucomicrobiae bacterium]